MLLAGLAREIRNRDFGLPSAIVFEGRDKIRAEWRVSPVSLESIALAVDSNDLLQGHSVNAILGEFGRYPYPSYEEDRAISLLAGVLETFGLEMPHRYYLLSRSTFRLTWKISKFRIAASHNRDALSLELCNDNDYDVLFRLEISIDNYDRVVSLERDALKDELTSAMKMLIEARLRRSHI